MLCLQYSSSSYLLLFLFPFLLFSFSSSSLHSSRPPPFLCHPHQSSALLQFKNSFQSTTTTNYNDWSCGQPILRTTTWENGTDCCSWEGVTCDSMSGHVIGLDLTCDGHRGYLHPNSTLFRLTHLQRLNLAFNGFDGSQLPSQIGGFVSLTHLNLSGCFFQGDLPSQISHLSKLVSLDLSWNFELKWARTTWKRLLQNATCLRQILSDDTDMSSISLSSLSNSSSSLVTLSLAYTRIEGDLTSDVLCLPNLELSLRGIMDQVHLPDKLNCRFSLSVLDLSGCSFEAGSIPSSFANLTHLTSLILSGNNLNGSIPLFLSNLLNLTHLDLSYNELNGPIPSSSLSNLLNLTHLDLSHNELNGPIPSSSLSNFQHLTFLDLSNNQLSGQVPDVFNELPELQTLSLSKNNLGGQLPSSLFALTQLSSLDCSFNNFVGPLPNKITAFSNLTHLHLSDNKLNEVIPSWCLSLSSLISLDLANNQFTGHISEISSSSLEDLRLCGNKLQGDIPESIFNLANLTFLCLSSNNSTSPVPVHFSLFSKFQKLMFLRLSGYSSLSLKSEINNVSYSFPSLEALHLLSNNLTDYAEASVKFPALFTLEISNSSLQGELPKWIRDIDGLDDLLLSHNLLTLIDPLPWNIYSIDLSSNLMIGDISSLICNATSLGVINLSHNKLTGTFPQCIANFSDLSILDLQMNNLHDTLPSTFSMITNLQTLNLNGNQFGGSLPESLSNCTLLEDLNLGNNQIEDSFPHWIQNLDGLQILVLRANKLYGPIVSMAVKNDPSSFPNLIFFDVSCNNFNGPFPEDYIRSFQAMKNGLQATSKTNVEYMETSAQIGSEYYIDYTIEYANSLIATMKGVGTPYGKIPKMLVNIDLSVNSFEGEIPNVIGELQGLIGLNLSHNKLSGAIPHSMGNLTNLESLDLSSNMLTGNIPIELANLNFLEFLNLSHNHLAGLIPQGKQFNTFPNESYDGNTELCGFPLTKLCNSGPESPSSLPASEMEEKFGFGWKPVAIGYACGMVFGIGLGWLVFFIGKPIWLVSMFGGSSDPNKRARRRRSRRTRTHHGNRARMN